MILNVIWSCEWSRAYLVFLLSVHEDKAVFAGGATDFNHSTAILFHGQVAEDVKFDFLSWRNFNL